MTKDTFLVRAERHADSDFRRALPHPVRHRSVNSHGREKQRDECQTSKQESVEFSLRLVKREQIAQDADVIDRKLRVDGTQLLVNGGDERTRIALRMNH